MEHLRLGRAGLEVSRAVLALEAGITTFDTANRYGSGGVQRAQVALAWVPRHSAVTAPIVGLTKEQQITDAIAATELNLTADEVGRLEEHYAPRVPEGF